jgi:ribosomal protein L39E
LSVDVIEVFLPDEQAEKIRIAKAKPVNNRIGDFIMIMFFEEMIYYNLLNLQTDQGIILV